ncbi:MAG: class I SAM-dependent methyltransferase family protein, partial [Euryarchaeota archaeon]|nr:class I SAM-dependent methyltransferase family protein [Euryarchaeota archaeon]
MQAHRHRRRVSFEELKRLARERLGRDAELLRGGWELIGDVLVLSLPKELYHRRYEIGELALELHPRARSVVVRQRIVHELRYPVAEVVAGDENTLTLHRENRCVFRVDPCRVMFSSGNQGERLRMAQLELRGERVVDMFAGIGQFTIPMAKHASPEKIVAIEKRRETFELLCENVRLNRVEHIVEPVLGDCREVAPSKFA